MLSRRSFVGVAGGSALACRGGQVAAEPVREASEGSAEPPVAAESIVRQVGRTGEWLPAIGMGTWETFDVGAGPNERAPLREVLRVFSAGGGRVIDSSPMYGAAEQVTGDLVAETGVPTFLATKVWTRGRAAGEAQMLASMRLLRTTTIDLMQVHNLLDFDTHITTLRRWRDEGKIRYIGATHYQLSAFDALERVIREEQLDFVQLPYSIGVREAEKRLLPAAADHGVAVLVMRPFEGGEIFKRVRGKALPEWAGELGCTSWAQIFLKFILGHPA
ncbi:MAG TPA: aldo/keto reductase, partial [Nannocystis sp.]